MIGSFWPTAFEGLGMLNNAADSALHYQKHASRRTSSNGVAFVSHSGLDKEQVDHLIVSPVLRDREHPDLLFFHSARSGGAASYKRLVLGALTATKYAIIVASKQSSRHLFVRAEADWLLDQDKPIVVCSIDGSAPEQIHPSLIDIEHSIDFAADPLGAAKKLTAVLETIDPRS